MASYNGKVGNSGYSGVSAVPKGIKQIGDSIWLVDMGKALNGWVELSFPKLPEGHRVRMEYTDWLNENEDFQATRGERTV